jgi:hypothetical protein
MISNRKELKPRAFGWNKDIAKVAKCPNVVQGKTEESVPKPQPSGRAFLSSPSTPNCAERDLPMQSQRLTIMNKNV